jgi:23S rRNA pseudoU1915 N3-methylase RlmH
MDKFDLSSLVKADVAGEALNPEVYERFLEKTGVKLREGFGQTETTVLLFNNEWIEPKPGSMGKPAAGWNIQLLDERGREPRSIELASWLEQKRNTARRLVFVIGGPYGFSPAVYQRANEQLSLSRLTFSHQMVRLVFTEQLYRACTIIKGEPYHHE